VAGSVAVAGSGDVAGCNAVAGSSDVAGNGDAAALQHQCSVFATLLSQQGSAFATFQVYLWGKAWVAQYTRVCPLSSNKDSTVSHLAFVTGFTEEITPTYVQNLAVPQETASECSLVFCEERIISHHNHHLKQDWEKLSC